MKVLHSICQHIWKTQQWRRDWKTSVFIPITKKGNGKEWSNYHTIVLISHTRKAMLKILQARLQQYMNCELPDVQAGFRKGRGTRHQIANILWIIEKAREFQKNIYFCFIDYAKAFDCVDHNKLWKNLQEMGIPDHLTCFLTFIQISHETGKVVWYSHLFKNFPQFVVIHTVKDFGVINKAEGDIFLEFFCFFNDPTDVGDFISRSPAFSKSNNWKFMVHILLKPALENFEHYFTSV